MDFNQQQQLFIFSPSCHKWNLTNNYCITATLTKHTTWNTVCYTVPVWLFKSWCHIVRGLSGRWLLSISSTLFSFVPCVSTGAGPHTAASWGRAVPTDIERNIVKSLWDTAEVFILHSPSVISLRTALSHHSLLHKKSQSWALADHHNRVGRAPHKLCLSLFSWLVVQRKLAEALVIIGACTAACEQEHLWNIHFY